MMNHFRWPVAAVTGLLAFGLPGCGGSSEPAPLAEGGASMPEPVLPAQPGGGAAPASPASMPGLVFPAQPGDEAASASPASAPAPLPDFVPADLGGWRLGTAVAPEAAEAAGAAQDGRDDTCGSTLTGVLRDLQESHPDFGGDITGLERGLVRDALGEDGKPALAPDFRRGFIESEESFRQWYESVPGVNEAFALAIQLAPNGDKFTFESHDFFPLDGAGFGNQGQNHNFSFTFELHTRFRYSGGEVFEFSGDDDLWVFINGRLAIDLGGVHEASAQQIALDREAGRLGISPGNEYALDFFQAERHATESNFQIDTTLEFTSCGSPLR